MESRSAAVLLVALLAACGAPAAPTPPPVMIELDRPQLVEVGRTYRVASTAIEITPERFTPLDTQPGHVLNAYLTATDGATRESLVLHAYHTAIRVPVIWHGLSLQLSEDGFVYGGSTATITVTRAPSHAPPPPPPPPLQAAPTCTAPGLEGSRAIDAVALPAGCRFVSGGATAAPRVVRTTEDLEAVLVCDPGIAGPPIDLETSELHVVDRMLSPAHASSEIRDDGAVITFVTRFRPPCPDDPRPMPSPGSFGFSLPRGAARTFREATCTLPLRCD